MVFSLRQLFSFFADMPYAPALVSSVPSVGGASDKFRHVSGEGGARGLHRQNSQSTKCRGHWIFFHIIIPSSIQSLRWDKGCLSLKFPAPTSPFPLLFDALFVQCFSIPGDAAFPHSTP